MQVLGISAFYHDSAAAILRDGEILAAAQEERFTRKKFDAAFPRQAITWCLGAAKTSLNEIAYVVFYTRQLLGSNPDRQPRGKFASIWTA